MHNPVRAIRWAFRRLTEMLTGRSKVIRVEIFMKSGNSFSVDVNKMEWQKLGDDFEGLTWTTPPFPTSKLSSISVRQIEAIVIHDL